MNILVSIFKEFQRSFEGPKAVFKHDLLIVLWKTQSPILKWIYQRSFVRNPALFWGVFIIGTLNGLRYHFNADPLKNSGRYFNVNLSKNFLKNPKLCWIVNLANILWRTLGIILIWIFSKILRSNQGKFFKFIFYSSFEGSK